MSTWHALSTVVEVDLSMTLCGGQCFRWRQTNMNTWVGVIGRNAYELCARVQAPYSNHERLFNVDTTGSYNSSTVPCPSLWFRCLNRELRDPLEVAKEKLFLHHYLALDVDLKKLWVQWTVDNPWRTHPLVRHLTESVTKEIPVSIRILRQDVHETLLAFLCSQNNNVKRITALVDTMAVGYGDFICYFDLSSGRVLFGKSDIKKGKHSGSGNWIALHSLPTVDQLARCTEAELRSKGFGYRSRYLTDVAVFIKSIGTVKGKDSVAESPVVKSYKWYDDLQERTLSLQDRREKLMALSGVGRKVADCVLLFGLGHHEVVPVDTHIAQVASEFLSTTAQHLLPKAKIRNPRKRGHEVLEEATQSDWEYVLARWSESTQHHKNRKHLLLPKYHDAIQEGFRTLFGEYCGWAHSILFYTRMRK